MIFLWLFLLFIAGTLMSLAHPFRIGSLEIEPNFLNFLFSSVGIALFMKVSGLRKKIWVRFALGSFSGLVFYSITLYWLIIALRDFGEISLPISAFISFILAAYCSLFFGAWAAISGLPIVREKNLFLRILIWSSAWASLEAVREHLFTGFSWGEIGYHFSAWPSLAPAASIWGVHGFSFLWIVLVSVVLHADEWLRDKRARFLVATTFVSVVSLGAIGIWLQTRNIEYQKIKIGLLQPNISQEMKWDPRSASQHLNQLISMSTKIAAENPDLALIVWPETSYPFLIANSQRQFSFSTQVPIILGGVVSDRRINKNSAILVESDQIVQKYEKVHLVPFGEYVPFEDWLPFKKLVANAGRFLPGDMNQELLQLKSLDLKMGTLICYEDIFSYLSVEQVQRGARLLINLTNDAWYGSSSALPQHAAISYMRYFQTLTPLVRSTNTGVTSVIDRNGRVKIPINQNDSLIYSLEIPKEALQTFFVRFYPFTEWIWILIFVIALIWRSKAQTKKIFYTK